MPITHYTEPFYRTGIRPGHNQKPAKSPKTPHPAGTIEQVTAEVHQLHMQAWDAFSSKLRQLAQSEADLTAFVGRLIAETSAQFQAIPEASEENLNEMPTIDLSTLK